MKLNKRKIFRWIKIILLIYCTIGIALYYLQEKFLFHPKRLAPDHVFSFKTPFQELKIPFNETDTMSVVKFFPDSYVTKEYAAKGVVVYYHGNMENIEHYAGAAKTFTSKGYEVWMEDYPGFGKSTGELTEDNLYTQAIELKRMADAVFPADSIIIYGKSLGTGIAAYVASHSKAKMLVLETPYYSIPALFATYAFIYPVGQMSTFKIPAYSYVQNTDIPVIIFHGTNDKVISYSCAGKLKEVLKPGDQFITVQNGHHNDIASFKEYQQKMDSLLSH